MCAYITFLFMLHFDVCQLYVLVCMRLNQNVHMYVCMHLNPVLTMQKYTGDLSMRATLNSFVFPTIGLECLLRFQSYLPSPCDLVSCPYLWNPDSRGQYNVVTPLFPPLPIPQFC